MSVPDELSLLSLFECEPKLLYDNVPYFYNEATYEFDNAANERFLVSISPANSDMKIQVYRLDANELNSLLQFKNADEVEILISNKEESAIRIKTDRYSVRIYFKPRFKIFLEFTD